MRANAYQIAKLYIRKTISLLNFGTGTPTHYGIMKQLPLSQFFLGFSMFTTLKQVEILQSSLQHSTASKKKHMQGEKKLNFFINFEFPKTTVEKGYFVHRKKRTS